MTPAIGTQDRRARRSPHEHKNDLNVWNGTALLVADCVGTGILALPHDIQVLGTRFGLMFLISCLPINFFAGLILSYSADHVEHNNDNCISEDRIDDRQQLITNATMDTALTAAGKNNNYQTLETASVDGSEDQLERRSSDERTSENRDAATFDFIGMTSAIFDDPATTRLVMILYYSNIFLVLGNYIIVMSHAVIALFDHDGNGDGVLSCLPIAGLLASTLMFAVCQMRTMARLGRTASTVSLSAMAIVLVQCLYFSRSSAKSTSGSEEFEDEIVGLRFLLRQFSACGSIGFATGSQKLFLNIRHEFADRNDAPKSLGLGLTAFGIIYVLIVLLAGTDPPGLLFDAIPRGSIHRQAAGFLLWVHVVVSYAINSQAICASMDRNFFSHWEPVRLWSDQRRWTALTAIMASAAFFIANAVPFFKDLVAFIGALTSVPITLLLPAIFYRRACEKVAVWFPPLTWEAITSYKSWGSYSLLVYSTIFMVLATLGSVYSILSDWEHHTGGFFSCE
eukprot:jgi/Psemu1/295492/fgenesh1_pm.68_\